VRTLHKDNEYMHVNLVTALYTTECNGKYDTVL
jgi:hypothetical protein